MKYFGNRTLLVFMLFSLVICSACTAEESADPSIGTQAGTAVREMQKTAEQSYEEASVKTREALEEFDAVARKNMEEFSEQATVALEQFQRTAEEMMQRLNEEMKKFNEAMKDQNNS